MDPLAEIAAVDGPTPPAADVGYLLNAIETGFTAATYGRRDVLHRAERVAADFGELHLTFGRWHGDWVPWNLGPAHGTLFAWDWAYARPPSRSGSTCCTSPPSPRKCSRREPRRRRRPCRRGERARAAWLGLDTDQVHAVAALHRLELELRDTRAWLLRRPERTPSGTAFG